MGNEMTKAQERKFKACPLQDRLKCVPMLSKKLSVCRGTYGKAELNTVIVMSNLDLLI